MRKEDFAEAFGDINEQHILRARLERKTEKVAWVKWSAMAACLCLAVIGALVVPVLQGRHGAENPQPGGTPGTSIVQPGNNHGAARPAIRNSLVINEVENAVTTDMDVQISHYNDLSTLERESVLKMFETIIGLSYNDFLAKISDAYTRKSFYTVDVPADAARTEYVPHDYVFEYQAGNGGRIRIAICSAEKPLRDCFFECDNPKQSEINGTVVVIYGYFGSFMVEFSHENINYDIETSNITMEELEDLLVGILE